MMKSRDYATVLQGRSIPMRRWLLLLCVLIGIVAFAGRPRAQGPTAAFHAVGDLPGGGFTTMIKDATRVGGVIYAVGGAVSRAVCEAPCNRTDTAILWRFDGTNATLTALPDLVTNNSGSTPNLSAFAITPDAAYIAGQARTTLANVQAVRVTTGLLPFSAANLNLSALFSPALSPSTSAVATSSDGTILYGSNNSGRAVRFDTVGATSLLIPTVSGSDTRNFVAGRGSSADGNVAVGTSFSTAADAKAYRYVHGTGVTAIPFLPGDTANTALAVSPDGDLVLVRGIRTSNPNGEAYLYRASTGAIQPLESPNLAWRPGTSSTCANGNCQGTLLSGGMTADGSVVAMSDSSQSAYVHNSHGWFHLAGALAANGVDIAADGWNANNLQIQGMSSDGTLIFGSGEHTVGGVRVVDGFVAEFGAGVLAGFNPPPAPRRNTSIVGAWTIDPSAPSSTVLVFTAEGAYYHIQGSHIAPLIPSSGYEWGYYTFDGSRLSFTTLHNTNGSLGVSDTNGSSFGATVNGDTVTLEGGLVLHRIAGSPGTLVGGWVLGDRTRPGSVVSVFTSGGDYLLAQDGPVAPCDRSASIEIGTFTWNATSGQLVTDVSQGVDQNCDGGLFDPAGPYVTANLTPDALGLVLTGPDGVFRAHRVIDPATIPVNGVVGQAFSYFVTASYFVTPPDPAPPYPLTFGATGLPDGLSINSNTGEINGTPSVGGQFAVTIFATNVAGVSHIETLTLTIAIPTPVGLNVVVAPVVPEGQGPVTLSFGEITSAGTTTVTIVDLNQSWVPPPGNVAIGGVVYEVTTTATYQGLITLCFSYAGIDFGSAMPRLFHYENNVWVDITTSVDPGTQTICGATTTLSPFAVLVSHVVRTGFYAPVNPIAGFLNTVQGGSTVPLKFNVSVNGVQQTTTAGLLMTVQLIACDSSAPQAPVEPAAVTGGTSLRYAGSNFIQNWKVPETPGCYMVRMTTTQDGLALTARFKVR